MFSNVHIYNVVAIKNDVLKQPWLPETKIEGDVTFIRLDKWDRMLAKFCTGSSLDLRKGKIKNANYLYFDQLQTARTAACDAAVVAAYAVDDAVAERPNKRQRKARLSDREIAPSVVEVLAPEVNRGGIHLPAVAMKMLFGIKNSVMWVELSPENLEHIRQGILASQDDEVPGRHWQKTRETQAAAAAANLEALQSEEAVVSDDGADAAVLADEVPVHQDDGAGN
ncbi:unnamed protein product [Polarella glacialis]|uniref:Uncharacterized protein n=1 Tax=Polarella glacialis TaxID=89957 RepID=A0A813FWQ8_POLGL|nr:unnamed protein product [Polarella glacialis]CAE8733904.1 unnamed protein product [Polarella glacialis]